MKYGIKELAALSGVSPRALRLYEDLGLLQPLRNPGNDYRVYGQREVDRLQAILFYRETGMKLSDIKALLEQDEAGRASALQAQLAALKAEAGRLNTLILTLEKTIRHQKEKEDMSDKEKFEGFKKNLVKENEAKYGREIRQKYGDKVIDESNAKVMGMECGTFDRAQALSEEVNRLLIEATATGDPAGDAAQNLCKKHKDWLMCYWPKYTKEMHLGVAEGYVADERFAKYYNDIVDGGAEFLRDAIRVFCA